MATGADQNIIILENHISLLKRAGGGSTTQPLHVIESLIARIRELEENQKAAIPEDLHTVLKALVEGGQFFGSDINLDYVRGVDSDDIHSIFEKYVSEHVQPKQQPYAYAYIDDKNRLVKISGHVYFDGGFVDANRAIPDSWKTLVLVEKVGA